MTITSKVASASSSRRVFGLIAGPAGIGKTTLLTNFPLGTARGVSVEQGFLSIEGSGVPYDEVTTYDDVIEIITKRVSTTDFTGVKTLFIDGLSEVYALLKNELRGKYDVKQNFQKYDEMNDKMFYLIRLARQLTHLNIFFTCHTKEEKNGMVLEEELAFDGSMPGHIKKQFDLIIHMKHMQFEGQQNSQRIFITSPMVSKIAKARTSPWLGVELEPYEYADLNYLTNKLLGVA